MTSFHRTRIKFCGLVDPMDLDVAVALGVDAVGFVFYERSPRFVDDALACRLRRRLPSWVAAVGLFVNASAPRVATCAREVGLDVIQFHGDEPQELCVRAAGGLPWWRAVRMRGPDDLVRSDAEFDGAEAFVLDAFVEAFGGAGRSFDWSWISRPASGRPIVLSGGLGVANVGQAIEAVCPAMVDVSSGIQTSDPRRKDHRLMEHFVQGALEADRRRAQIFSKE